MRNIFLFRERKTTDSYVGKKKSMYRMEIYYVEHGKLQYKNKNPMAFLTVYCSLVSPCFIAAAND